MSPVWYHSVKPDLNIILNIEFSSMKEKATYKLNTILRNMGKQFCEIP